MSSNKQPILGLPSHQPSSSMPWRETGIIPANESKAKVDLFDIASSVKFHFCSS